MQPLPNLPIEPHDGSPRRMVSERQKPEAQASVAPPRVVAKARGAPVESCKWAQEPPTGITSPRTTAGDSAATSTVCIVTCPVTCPPSLAWSLLSKLSFAARARLNLSCVDAWTKLGDFNLTLIMNMLSFV